MAQLKSKWTDSVYTRVKVLNHSKGLRLERFTSEELDQIADCDDVLELTLDRSKMKEPLDLARIAHITSLRKLELEGLKFTNLQALRALPRLGTLIIDTCRFSDFDALNGFKVLSHLYLWHNKLTAFPAGLDLPQFEALFISDNLISDLGFVQSYPGLGTLYLKRNQITDLSPLAACPAVVDLEVQDNPVTSLAPLAAVAKLSARVLAVAQPMSESCASRIRLVRLPVLMPTGQAVSHRPQVVQVSSPAYW